MIELTIIIVCLIALNGYQYYANTKERKDLVRAILAKSLYEVTDAEAVDKMKPQKEVKPSDWMSADSMDDVGFDAMIKQQTAKVADNK